MKRKPEEYSNTHYYDDMDSEVLYHKEKVVKCRKPHMCVGGCENEIKAGEYALLETGFLDGKPVSCYTCTACLDAWLDELEGYENDEDCE